MPRMLWKLQALLLLFMYLVHGFRQPWWFKLPHCMDCGQLSAWNGWTPPTCPYRYVAVAMLHYFGVYWYIKCILWSIKYHRWAPDAIKIKKLVQFNHKFQTVWETTYSCLDRAAIRSLRGCWSRDSVCYTKHYEIKEQRYHQTRYLYNCLMDQQWSYLHYRDHIIPLQ